MLPELVNKKYCGKQMTSPGKHFAVTLTRNKHLFVKENYTEVRNSHTAGHGSILYGYIGTQDGSTTG